jgi:hypothetical protein
MTPTARFLLELLAAEIAAELARPSVVETVATTGGSGLAESVGSAETPPLLDGENAEGHINRHASDQETLETVRDGTREGFKAR